MNMNTKKLAGKVAVVTGASKGIGAGIAKEFVAEGASVVVNYASSKEGADKVVDEIGKRGGKQSPSRATSRRRQKSSGCSLKRRKPSGKSISWLITPAFTNSFHSKDRKSTRLNSSHVEISYAVFCLK